MEEDTMKNEFPAELTKQISMTEDNFWSLVAYADWPNKGYDSISAEYLRLLSREECKEFRTIASSLWNILDKAVGVNRNPAGGGDDSHSDLLYHIIGLGRDEFYAHLNNYDLMDARGKAPYDSNDGYKESFSYCIPYDTDYDKKNDLPHFQKWAEKAQTELDAIIENNNDKGVALMKPLLSKVAYILEFFVNGDVKGGMKQYEDAESYLAQVKQLAKEQDNNDILYGPSAMAYTCNFFHDFKKYMEVELEDG